MDNGNHLNTWTETEERLPRQRFKQRRRLLRKRSGLAKRLVSLALSAALFGGVSAGTFHGISRLLTGEESAVPAENLTSDGAVLTSLASTSYSTARYGMDVSDIAAAALPSVVAITNISVQEVQNFFNRFGPNGAGRPQLEETTSCGSGIIIANDGDYLYIVTNAHVVENASTLSASFVDNSVCEAQLCGTDEEIDLAVLKIALSDLSSDTLSQIAVIAVGDSDLLEVGEQVVAIGNALGYGQSVTTGIVSALNRSLTSESGAPSIQEIKEYLALCLQGESTIPRRKALLAKKQAELSASIGELQDSIAYIDWKQNFYDEVLSGKRPYVSNLIPVQE